jgi:hypothetical protein
MRYIGKNREEKVLEINIYFDIKSKYTKKTDLSAVNDSIASVSDFVHHVHSSTAIFDLHFFFDTVQPLHSEVKIRLLKFDF